MARKRKEINLKLLEKLAEINCSYEEMSSIMEVDESTLSRNYAQVIKKGRDKGKMSLKRKQWEVAMSGNVSMLIWLGKQLLGQTDKNEITGNLDTKAEVIIK